tara:strand:+ start:1471 stop:1917 length:447 start_codon:yes stop_codon:yes gene_type:complete
MKKLFFVKIFIIYLLFISNSLAAQSSYFNEGIKLYKNKQFDKSKILFERDIVFNPKNEKSYLYLAKIFNKKDNDEEQEINLDNVLLLNPQNDEAIYMLTILKIKQSDYNEAKELIDRFVLVCKSFCSKTNEIQEKFKKLTPENEKNKN